jgi:hypothetical protein
MAEAVTGPAPAPAVDAARVLLADDARLVADCARELVAVALDAADPCECVRSALAVVEAAERLVTLGWVAASLSGRSWRECVPDRSEQPVVASSAAVARWWSSARLIADRLRDHAGLPGAVLRDRRVGSVEEIRERVRLWYTTTRP